LPERYLSAGAGRHWGNRSSRPPRGFSIATPVRPRKRRKGVTSMIRVRKIAHATYEMPELDKQVEYYTGILGLTLTAKEKDAAYLANTVDHHAVVLRRGSVVKCTRIGFQIGPDEDLDAFDKQTAAHGIKSHR